MSTPTTSLTELLTADSRAAIDGWVAKYPPERKLSAVMAALVGERGR